MLINEVFEYSTFARLGFVEQFDFCQYKVMFDDAGEFNLKCPITDKNVDILKINNIIWFERDIAGIIQSIDVDSVNNKNIQVSGFMLNIMLDWRCVYPTINVTEEPQKIMEDIVTKNCISCDNVKRNFSRLHVRKKEFGLDKISKQKTGGSVLEFMTEFAKANELGFKVAFNPKEKKLVFEVLKGVDRSFNNKDGNKKVYFSDSLNNIINVDYINDETEYRNTILVDGEVDEETKIRTSLMVYEDNIEQSDLERRELYVDARDLQSEVYEESGESKKLTPEQYKSNLNQRGLEKIGENCRNVSIESEVRNDSETLFRFFEDYYLGDKVTIIKEDLHFYSDAIVTAVTITQDKNKYTVEPTLGNARPTIYQKLKRGGISV